MLRPGQVALALALLASSLACANPIGLTVVNGAVATQPVADLLQVTAAPGSIGNWQSFSIGASQVTRINQQSASSAMLNRVTGAAASDIQGGLQSNGTVFLLNSSGIAFGSGSQVQAAGFTASTLNLSNADFLAGAYQFSPIAGAGNILNQGLVNISAGGTLTLAAPEIVNTGVLAVSGGGGIVLHGNVVNNGEIRADGGSIAAYNGTVSGNGSYFGDSIFFGSVNTGGDPAVINVGDLVIFAATSDIEIHLGGLTPGVDYDRITAGTIVLQGGALTLDTSPGFVPQAGDEFDILGALTLTGTFGSLDLPALRPNLYWDTSSLYIDGTISVAAAAVPAPGSLALMLGGLLLLSAVVRRRNFCAA